MAERKRRSTKKEKEEQEVIKETKVENNENQEEQEMGTLAQVKETQIENNENSKDQGKTGESNQLPPQGVVVEPPKVMVEGDGDTGITPEELSKILKPTKQEDEETEAPGKKEPTKEELFQTALVDCLITRARMPEAEAKKAIERLGLSLESRADIVKLFSDDIISLKMKFREFKRRFIQNNK